MHHHWMVGIALTNEQTAVTGQKFKHNNKKKVKIGKEIMNYQHNTLSVRQNHI